MNKNPKDLMVEILTIVGYTDDKEKCAEKFLNLCLQRALLDLSAALLKDKQESLGKELSQRNSPQKVQEIMWKYFSPEDYTKALEQATGKAFTGYIQTVLPTLSTSQRDDLQEFLASLGGNLAVE